VPPTSIAIASTPVVIAMPRPMAEQLGWPDRQFGWADLFTSSGSTTFWPEAGRPEWGAFKVGMANPENSTAALRAVIGVVSARHDLAPAKIDDTTFDRDRSVQFDVLTMERSAALLPETSTEVFGALWEAEQAAGADTEAGPPAPVSAFPAYEYEVLAFNRGVGSPTGQPPATPLVAFYPPDGRFATTVPYVVMPRAGRDPARASAATDLGRYLRGEEGRSVLLAAGLRTPEGDAPPATAGPDDAGTSGTTTSATRTSGTRTSGTESSSGTGSSGTESSGTATSGPDRPAPAGQQGLGITAERIAPPTEDAGQAALGTARRFFRHVHQRGSTLAVVDVSGSMDRIVPGTDPPRTRLEVAIEAALQGVRLFAPNDHVGLWVFASALDGTRGYREMSPVAPLDSPGRYGTHLDDLVHVQYEVEAAGATALYTTALAAFRHLNARYVEGRLNQVVILTDGRNDNPGDPDEISLDELLTTLRAEFNPERPVRIITIAYSEDADTAALEQISAATDARSYLSRDPRDVLGVFIDAVTQAGT